MSEMDFIVSFRITGTGFDTIEPRLKDYFGHVSEITVTPTEYQMHHRYSIYLTYVGPKKIAVIKEVRSYTEPTLGLKAAKDLVERVADTGKEEYIGTTDEIAEIQTRFGQAGALIRIALNDPVTPEEFAETGRELYRKYHEIAEMSNIEKP